MVRPPFPGSSDLPAAWLQRRHVSRSQLAAGPAIQRRQWFFEYDRDGQPQLRTSLPKPHRCIPFESVRPAHGALSKEAEQTPTVAEARRRIGLGFGIGSGGKLELWHRFGDRE